MAFFDPHALSLLVRWVHVASMAFLLGGALLLCGLSLRGGALPAAERARLLVFVAGRYEFYFWLALGLIVITGIGNLGALGLALPGPGTVWGARFVVKLALVLLFVPLSLVRTLLIAGLDSPHRAFDPAGMLRNIYGGTAAYAIAILFMAVSLAHGG